MTVTDANQGECYCCGGTVPVDQLARMLCHPDVAVCAGCADWLATWSKSLVRAVPVLKTDDLAASIAFWEAAGFAVEQFGGDFAVAQRDGVELHVVKVRPDGRDVEVQPEGRDRGEAYLHARDVDAVHAAWSAAGLPVSALHDEPWGMREFNVVDPDGNRLRIGRSV